MYQVVRMYGDAEPWWFLEGWEEDIVTSREFSTYPEAYLYYKMECIRLELAYPKQEIKAECMAAFWDPTEQVWCEECEEYLQQFHSVMIIKSYENLRTGAKGVRRPHCQLK
ncbi:DUF1033 family protein [Streptococcus cameli]